MAAACGAGVGAGHRVVGLGAAVVGVAVVNLPGVLIVVVLCLVAAALALLFFGRGDRSQVAAAWIFIVLGVLGFVLYVALGAGAVR